MSSGQESVSHGTKPGMFEGIGVEGLPWMSHAKKITGLPITVEVATARHVEVALQFDVDMLWLEPEQLSIHSACRKCVGCFAGSRCTGAD